MCRAKSEGGRRCRCDGTKPLPRNRAERQAELAQRAATAAARRTRKATDQRRHRERKPAVAHSPSVKESKALTAARQRLEMARAAGASQKVIDMLSRRVDAAKPKPKTAAQAASSAPSVENPFAELLASWGMPSASASPPPSSASPVPPPPPPPVPPPPPSPSASPVPPSPASASASASASPAPASPVRRIPAADAPFAGRVFPSPDSPSTSVAAAHHARAVLQAQGQSQLLPFEPDHVLAVAHGEGARWVPIEDGQWAITARGDEVRPDGTVAVTRRDGSQSVERISSVVTSGLVDGHWVGVVRPALRG